MVFGPLWGKISWQMKNIMLQKNKDENNEMSWIREIVVVFAGTDKAESFNDALIIIVIANCGGR